MILTVNEALIKVRELYNELDKICNVDTNNIELKFSDRATKRLGCCHYDFVDETKKPVKIALQTSLLTFDTEAELIDVAKHEYAHAVACIRHPNKRIAHGPIWQNICREIGCRPKATAPIQWTEEGAKLQEEKAKYAIQCDCCGRVNYCTRRNKFVNWCLANADAEGNVPKGDWRCTKCKDNGYKILKGM